MTDYEWRKWSITWRKKAEYSFGLCFFYKWVLLDADFGTEENREGNNKLADKEPRRNFDTRNLHCLSNNSRSKVSRTSTLGKLGIYDDWNIQSNKRLIRLEPSHFFISRIWLFEEICQELINENISLLFSHGTFFGFQRRENS